MVKDQHSTKPNLEYSTLTLPFNSTDVSCEVSQTLGTRVAVRKGSEFHEHQQGACVGIGFRVLALGLRVQGLGSIGLRIWAHLGGEYLGAALHSLLNHYSIPLGSSRLLPLDPFLTITNPQDTL